MAYDPRREINLLVFFLAKYHMSVLMARDLAQFII
jgi:hypothetical protein